MTRAASGRTPKGSSETGSSVVIVQSLSRYFAASELPLTILLFLLPMLVLYEVGTRYFASDWARQAELRVLAFTMFRQFMELFGASGRYLPPLAVVAILLGMHIARRDRWEMHIGTAVTMAFESALLALPLLALGSIFQRYSVLYAGVASAKSGFVLALGAGIYEELVFRLMAFAVLSILLIDLLKLRNSRGYVLIVLSSSIAFAAYHYWGPMAEPFRLSDFVFRTMAGVYFGWLFMSRGFGVTAGSHVAYDMYCFGLQAACAT